MNDPLDGRNAMTAKKLLYNKHNPNNEGWLGTQPDSTVIIRRISPAARRLVPKWRSYSTSEDSQAESERRHVEEALACVVRSE